MVYKTPWIFYGRRVELQRMRRVLERRRWPFLQISGCRFIGKRALIQQALQEVGIDQRLYVQPLDAIEYLAGQLYEERSRLALGGFPLSERVYCYWDCSDVEIDLLAINEDEQRIRPGTCKRNPERSQGLVDALQRSESQFVSNNPKCSGWCAEYVAIATAISENPWAARGVVAESLSYRTAGL